MGSYCSQNRTHTPQSWQAFTGASLLIAWPCPFSPSPQSQTILLVFQHTKPSPFPLFICFPSIQILFPQLPAHQLLSHSFYLTSSKAPSVEPLSNVTFLNDSTFNFSFPSCYGSQCLLTLTVYLTCILPVHYIVGPSPNVSREPLNSWIWFILDSTSMTLLDIWTPPPQIDYIDEYIWINDKDMIVYKLEDELKEEI